MDSAVGDNKVGQEVVGPGRQGVSSGIKQRCVDTWMRVSVVWDVVWEGSRVIKHCPVSAH